MNIARSEEYKLVERLHRGDRKALEQLYRSYHSELFRYALKLTADAQLAEDAMQDTFVAVWAYREKMTRIKSMRLYLLQVIRNQSLRLLKRKKRFQWLGSQPDFRIQINPEELRLKDNSQIAKQKLAKALKTLTVRQQEVIYLKFYENLDYQEIADLLSINYQSVVNHIYRAMQVLRKADAIRHLDQDY